MIIHTASHLYYDQRDLEDNLVCISRSVPQRYFTEEGEKIYVCHDLAPSYGLVMGFRNNQISWDDYKKGFGDELKERSHARNEEELGRWVVSLLQDISRRMRQSELVLLCYEREPKLCHRRLVYSLLPDTMKGRLL